jgi:hypothetical protein
MMYGAEYSVCMCVCMCLTVWWCELVCGAYEFIWFVCLGGGGYQS